MIHADGCNRGKIPSSRDIQTREEGLRSPSASFLTEARRGKALHFVCGIPHCGHSSSSCRVHASQKEATLLALHCHGVLDGTSPAIPQEPSGGEEGGGEDTCGWRGLDRGCSAGTARRLALRFFSSSSSDESSSTITSCSVFLATALYAWAARRSSSPSESSSSLSSRSPPVPVPGSGFTCSIISLRRGLRLEGRGEAEALLANNKKYYHPCPDQPQLPKCRALAQIAALGR